MILPWISFTVKFSPHYSKSEAAVMASEVATSAKIPLFRYSAGSGPDYQENYKTSGRRARVYD